VYYAPPATFAPVQPVFYAPPAEPVVYYAPPAQPVVYYAPPTTFAPVQPVVYYNPPPSFVQTPVFVQPPVQQQVVYNPAPMVTTGGQSVYGTLYNGGMGNCRQTSMNQQIVSDSFCACLSVGQSGDCSNPFGRRRLLSSATQKEADSSGLMLALSACGGLTIVAAMVATGRVLVRHLIDKRVEEYLQARAA